MGYGYGYEAEGNEPPSLDTATGVGERTMVRRRAATGGQPQPQPYERKDVEERNIRTTATILRDHPEKFLARVAYAVLDRYYAHHRYFITQHQLHHYNAFLTRGLRTVIASMNRDFEMIKEEEIAALNPPRRVVRSVQVMVGGDEDASGVYLDKPTLVDTKNGESRLMFPNEARLRGLNYTANIYVDIRLLFRVDGALVGEKTLPRYRLGILPIMLHSLACPLHDQPPRVLREMGECPYDQGGYFIIGGGEKVVVARESLVLNRLFISASRDPTKPPYVAYEARVQAVEHRGDLFPKTVRFYVYENDASQRRNVIDVQIPGVKGKLPLFVLFRALGLESDRDIFAATVGEENVRSTLAAPMRSSALAAAKLGVFDQLGAARFITERTNYGTLERMKQVLVNDLFPNAGKGFDGKVVYLAFLVGKLLRAVAGIDPPTDRDTYEHKRVNVTGTKFANLFRDVYARWRKIARNRLDFEYLTGSWRRHGAGEQAALLDFLDFVNPSNYRSVFDAAVIDSSIVASFKGAWNIDETAAPGREGEFQEKGVVQELNRISYLSYVSHVRRVVYAGEIMKMREPHFLYATQWGAICPVETPDGQNVGITKHLATLCYVTPHVDHEPLVTHLTALRLLRPASFRTVPPAKQDARRVAGTSTDVVRVIVNDILMGFTEPPQAALAERYLLALRRNGLLHPLTSVRWETGRGEFVVLTQGGRCTRPLFIVDQPAPPEVPGYTNTPGVLRVYGDGAFATPAAEWPTLLLGTLLDAKAKAAVLPRDTGFTDAALHPDARLFAVHAAKDANDVGPATQRLARTAGALEYVDLEEANARLVAMAPADLERRPCQRYTHCEVHPSTILSIPATCIPLMDRNQAVRNVLSMAQSKQAVSLPFTNYADRMDTMAAVLNSPELPLVTTSFANRLFGGHLAYGQNAIVAIAAFTGYNQEDAVILKRDAVERGLFGSTHYHAVRIEEADSGNERIYVGNPLRDARVQWRDEASVTVNDRLPEEERRRAVAELREERARRFVHIGPDGLPAEGAWIREGDVLLGRIHVTKEVVTRSDAIGLPYTETREVMTDASEVADRSTAGIVDRVFMSAGRGNIRIRQVRFPEFGDKFASRHGQKGVTGMIVSAAEMPYSATSGITPDIVINPHAFPSRMTVGHLVECMLARAAAMMGTRLVADTFQKNNVFAEAIADTMEREYGMQRYGDEIMYNGRSGEQIATPIFIGPTYYMRLKHMVADKINFRATGPRTAITRQPNKGRGRHGGLRIGEMEGQALLSHGVSAFLKEGFMEKSDKHYLDVDAQDGTHARVSTHRGARLTSYDPTSADVRRVDVPYAWKVMQQELAAMGIDTRLVVGDGSDEALYADASPSEGGRGGALDGAVNVNDRTPHVQFAAEDVLGNALHDEYEHLERGLSAEELIRQTQMSAPLHDGEEDETTETETETAAEDTSAE